MGSNIDHISDCFRPVAKLLIPGPAVDDSLRDLWLPAVDRLYFPTRGKYSYPFQ